MRHTGRPAGESGNNLLQHIHSTIPPSLLPDEDTNPGVRTQLVLLHNSVKLLCGAVICLNCCCKWIQVNPSLSCPCCYTHSLSSSAIKQPSSLLTTLLENLPIICVRGCDKVVKLVEYRSHLEGKCKSYYQHDIHSPSHMTSSTDQLQHPPLQQMICSLSTIFEPDSSKGIARVKTRGQVRINERIRAIINDYL